MISPPIDAPADSDIITAPRRKTPAGKEQCQLSSSPENQLTWLSELTEPACLLQTQSEKQKTFLSDFFETLELKSEPNLEPFGAPS
jgi:hypothetical protein